MSSEFKDEKDVIRKKYLGIRDKMPIEEREAKSLSIINNLKEMQEVKDAENILIYVNFKSEAITKNFINYLINNTKSNIFVPIVTGADMVFYRIDSLSELQSGFQGILEPKIQKSDSYFSEYYASMKCVALIPGAVYDMQGGRLGYGRGFYDRFLSRYTKIKKIGMSFEGQISKKPIPREEHDVLMDFLVTEERIYEFQYE